MYEKNDGRLVSLCVFLCFSSVSRVYRVDASRSHFEKLLCVHPVFVWSYVVLVNLAFTYPFPDSPRPSSKHHGTHALCVPRRVGAGRLAASKKHPAAERGGVRDVPRRVGAETRLSEISTLTR